MEMKDTGALGVVGYFSVQKQLSNYLRSGRRHPSLILAGEGGDAKKQIARNLAKGLLCLKKPDGFCGECSSCRRIEADLHPDVFTLKEEGDGHEPLKIDSIREICHQMEISSLEGGAKVCLIEECHRMTAASANAFLKTLEEPRPDRYFILITTHASAMLPTILSRCLQFHFVSEASVEIDHAAYEAWLTEAQSSQSASQIVSKLDEKDTCAAFLKFLQTKLHDRVLAGSRGSATSAALLSDLDLFEETVRLEGRLRSNANYGLLVENFLRQHWIRNPGASGHRSADLG